jgi:two-component system, response regulator YesN
MDRFPNVVVRWYHMTQMDRYFTLIIVDDEESIRQGLAQYVDWKAMGFTVVQTFEDGRDALDFFLKQTVDAVLTDIKMADVSGLQLAEAVHNRYPNTAVVIMSGYRDFDYAKQAISYNVRNYLLKPVGVEQLKETFSLLYAEITERKTLSGLRELLPQYEEILLRSLHDRKPASEQELETVIDDLVCDREEAQAPSKDDYILAIITKACTYIDDNLSQDISLDEVADHVHLSPVYFSRFFKQHCGRKFISHLTEARMQLARQLLDSRKYRVHTISSMVGYRNSKYFTRVFKKTFKVTPTEYLHARL